MFLNLFFFVYVAQKITLCCALYHDATWKITLCAFIIELLVNVVSNNLQYHSSSHFPSCFLPSFNTHEQSPFLHRNLNLNFLFCQMCCDFFYICLMNFHEQSSQYPIFYNILMFFACVHVATYTLLLHVPFIHMWLSLFVVFSIMSDIYMLCTHRFATLASLGYLVVLTLVHRKHEKLADSLRTFLPVLFSAAPHFFYIAMIINEYNFKEIANMWRHCCYMDPAGSKFTVIADLKMKMAIVRYARSLNKRQKPKVEISGSFLNIIIPNLCFRLFCLYNMISHILNNEQISFNLCANVLVTSAEVCSLPCCYSIFQLFPYSFPSDRFECYPSSQTSRTLYLKLLQSRAFCKVLKNLFVFERGFIPKVLLFLTDEFFAKNVY